MRSVEVPQTRVSDRRRVGLTFESVQEWETLYEHAGGDPALHRQLNITDEQRERFVALYLEALVEAGLPDDEPFRQAVREHVRVWSRRGSATLPGADGRRASPDQGGAPLGLAGLSRQRRRRAWRRRPGGAAGSSMSGCFSLLRTNRRRWASRRRRRDRVPCSLGRIGSRAASAKSGRPQQPNIAFKASPAGADTRFETDPAGEHPIRGVSTQPWDVRPLGRD
jgi:hypothetical protein